MIPLNKQVVALFVERCSQQWGVRDPEQLLDRPFGQKRVGRRQPFTPTDDSELDPVPRHHFLQSLEVPF